MARQPETNTYPVDIYQLETTDPVQGGVGGLDNAPLLALASRTNYLKGIVDALTAAMAATAPLLSPGFTGSPTAPTAAASDNSTKIATTAFAQRMRSGILNLSVTGGSATLTADQAALQNLYISGTLTAAATVNIPAAAVGLYRIVNQTTGAYVLTVKTTTGTGLVIPQGTTMLAFADGSNLVDGVQAANGLTLGGVLKANAGVALPNNVFVSAALASGTSTPILGFSSGNDLYVGSTTSAHNATLFENNGTALANLSAAGNLAIGTGPTASAYRLLASAPASAEMRVQTQTSGDAIISAEVSGIATGSIIMRRSGPLTLGINGGSQVAISAGTGFVGINTTSPTQSLQVNGAIQIGGAATIGAAVGPGLYSFENPIFREYIGDGTGYSRAFSRRNSSTTTDLVTITDAGNLLVGTISNPNNREVIVGGRSVAELVLKSTSASGSVGSSTLYFGNSASDGTGWVNYDHSANCINFGTVGAERLRIDSSGCVGIGITNPGAFGNLAVVGSVTSMTTDASSLSSMVATVGGLVLSAYKSTGSGISFQVADAGGNVAERLRIDSSGNVSIGGTPALTRLYVSGSSGQTSMSIDDINAAGYSSYRLGNGTGLPGANGAALHYMNAGYAPSGAYLPNGTTLTGFGSGGLTLNADAAGSSVRVFLAGAQTAAFGPTGMTLSGGLTLPLLITSTATEAMSIRQDSGFISFWDTAYTKRSGYIQAIAGSGGMVISAEAAGSVQFGVPAGEAMRIAANANVLIGTKSDNGNLLQVNGTVSATTFIGNLAWSNVTSKPTAVSAFTNDSGYITSSALTWANVANKPTVVSAFTNDSEYLAAASFSSSRVANGYMVRSDGMIEMWGTHTNSNDTETVAFPTMTGASLAGFPNAVLNVSLTMIGNNGNSSENQQVSAVTNSNFLLRATAQERSVYWRAIGY